MKVFKDTVWTEPASAAKEITLAEAVTEKLYPSAYSYDGQLEKLQAHIDLQSELIVKLVTLVSNKMVLTAEDVEGMLGYGYKVED